MKRIATGIGLLVTGPILLFLAGCGTTPPTNFYLLTPAEQLKPSGGEGDLSELVIGVGPIRLSDYLLRPQIVARENVNRLQIEEFERWGGALETNITWVLAENISALLGTDSVVIHPWERAIRPDFAITANIRRLDTGADNQLELVALWGLLSSRGEQVLALRRSEIREPVDEGDMDSLVAAQSRALARMSEEIAGVIRGLHREAK